MIGLLQIRCTYFQALDWIETSACADASTVHVTERKQFQTDSTDSVVFKIWVM